MDNLEAVYKQLSPNSRQLVKHLVEQMAKQEGIHINLGKGYKPPIKNLDLWVANMRTESKSPRTIDMYAKDVRRLLAKMPAPTELELQQYFASRLESVTPSRIASEQKALKSLFKFLHKHGLYPSNPVEDITLMHGREAEVECPPDETIMTLLRYNTRREKDRARFRLMLFLLIQTGLRIEEACSIRRTWINMPACEVRVIGKGNKERVVPMGLMVTQLLKDFMEQVEPSSSQWLFPGNTKSGYWNDSGFRGALYLACKKLELKRIHPHQLRHYFATRTLENGAKLEVISRILGHASVDITARTYRHIQLKEYHSEHDKHNPLGLLPQKEILALPGGPVVEGTFKELPALPKEEVPA